MNTKTATKVILVLFVITMTFCITEIVCSYKIFLDPTGSIRNVNIGLQVIMLCAIIPSISGTIFGVREPLLPLMISSIVNIIIYTISGILVVVGVIETSYTWLLVILMICKIILLVVLFLVMYRFVKKLVKNQQIEAIDEENDYAFKRFGKYFYGTLLDFT